MEKRGTRKRPIRLGDRVKSNLFGWAEVTEYNGKNKIRVKFDGSGETYCGSKYHRDRRFYKKIIFRSND